MQILKYSLAVVALVMVSVFAPIAVVQAKECWNSDGGRAVVADDAACPTTHPLTTAPTTNTALDPITNIIARIFQTLFVLLVTASGFMLLYAAFFYITSEGEQEKVGKAKKLIVYVVIALIIAALAWIVPKAIINYITPGTIA